MKDCFGHDFDPDDAECVPNCPKFIECYNRSQRDPAELAAERFHSEPLNDFSLCQHCKDVLRTMIDEEDLGLLEANKKQEFVLQLYYAARLALLVDLTLGMKTRHEQVLISQSWAPMHKIQEKTNEQTKS